MTTAIASVHSALAEIVGDAHVVSEPSTCAGMAVSGKTPQHIVSPSTAECVAAVLKFAAEHDLAVITRGNGTKLGLSGPPSRYDLALSLKELTHVWHYEPADLTITVEPGMRFADLQDFLGRENLWLPLDPRGGANATLGGILATNSVGPLRLRFGSARDMVLGLRVATTEGKLIKSGGRVVKNVAGYDLSKLMVGSFGTLGVIVEASLKLYPRPPARATWVLEAGSLGLARDLRGRILNSPLEPFSMVLLNPTASGILQEGPNADTANGLELWIEVGGSTSVLERHARDLADMGRSMGVESRRVSEQAAESCWARLRNYEELFGGLYPDVLVLKANLPIASCEGFISLAQQEAEGEGMKMASFAQVGVGIVHMCLWGANLVADSGRLVENTRKAAASVGGALLVEQYPRGFVGERDIWGAQGDSIEPMRRLKAAWDPRGILAPGTFVGGI